MVIIDLRPLTKFFRDLVKAAMSRDFYQKGSNENSTCNIFVSDLGIELTQALMISPFTSISQAPQLPVIHPVGIDTPAFFASFNQSAPELTIDSLPFGHWII